MYIFVIDRFVACFGFGETLASKVKVWLPVSSLSTPRLLTL